MPISEIYTLVYSHNRHLLSADHLPGSVLRTFSTDGPNPVGFQSNKTGKAIKTQAQRLRLTNACGGDGMVFSAVSTPCVAHCGVFVQES